MKIAIQLLLVLLLGMGVVAQQAKPLAEDPALEQRVMELSKELRCLVCQNETLADSRADLANDLRKEIREQMRAGKSDKEIIEFMTARYGQFVLYRPPVQPTTYLLWFGPFLLLLGGLAFLYRTLKQRRELIVEPKLSEVDRRRAAELLNSQSKKETA
jgi:cytochrome c-type biogenesis protein CcmH